MRTMRQPLRLGLEPSGLIFHLMQVNGSGAAIATHTIVARLDIRPAEGGVDVDKSNSKPVARHR